MATSTPARRAWRVLTGLLVFTAVLFGVNALGVHVVKGGTWVPELALDLQGGTQIILEAQTDNGEPSAEQMTQAVAIIRQRVDASGVGESEISTQGGKNIVVLRGGAYDTPAAGATCDFRLSRAAENVSAANTGFRCCKATAP